MQGGVVLDYDHPLIEALDAMAWDEIRDQIEEVPGEGWRHAGTTGAGHVARRVELPVQDLRERAHVRRGPRRARSGV
ncbi:MAG TPA: hypothetical protein VK039_08580, partial [Brevibacterium sp.]|nr:hypothetical protein [Brevibacterium sp.]